jgi:hypothetical protein
MLKGPRGSVPLRRNQGLSVTLYGTGRAGKYVTYKNKPQG